MAVPRVRGAGRRAQQARNVVRTRSHPLRGVATMNSTTTAVGSGSAAAFHLAAQCADVVVAVDGHVGEGDHCVARNRLEHPCTVRKAARQGAERQAARRRNRVAPAQESALTVEYVTRYSVALRGSRTFGAEGARDPGSFAAQHSRKDADACLQRKEVERPPQRGVPAGRIGRRAILRETVPRAGVGCKEDSKDAIADVVEDLAPIRLLARRDVEQAGVRQPPPSACGRNTRARSCTPAGGKARPSSGQSRLVALATAAISIAAFVRATEGNGCTERFIRTLKEKLL